MRFKMLSIAAAAVLLLAACGSTPEESGATTGGGASTVSSTTTSTIAGAAAGSQEDLVATVGDRVFFGFDQYDLNEGNARPTVEALAAWMKANPSVVLTIEGHTDERGTREYNLGLGERRASTVRDYLMALGIQGTRVSTISYGEERPAVLGSNEDAWAQNRRAVFVVR